MYQQLKVSDSASSHPCHKTLEDESDRNRERLFNSFQPVNKTVPWNEPSKLERRHS